MVVENCYRALNSESVQIFPPQKMTKSNRSGAEPALTALPWKRLEMVKNGRVRKWNMIIINAYFSALFAIYLLHYDMCVFLVQVEPRKQSAVNAEICSNVQVMSKKGARRRKT